MPHVKQTLSVAIACLCLAGCDRYMDRRDGVTFGSGDAVAANRAMHIIDPWPRGSQTIEPGISGEQAEAAIEKFRRRAAGTSAEPAPSASPLSAKPTTPSNP